MTKKPCGIVMLYDRSEGDPQKVSKKFSESFSDVTENLFKQELIGLSELKEIITSRKIYWAGIKEKFSEILEDTETLGGLVRKVFMDHSGTEPSDEVKCLIYDGEKAPWGYSIVAGVVYE